jgi:hypothetical protein
LIKLNPKKKGKRIIDSAYLDAVAALGCCLCGQPAQIHHVRAGEGAGQRASDYRSIPLCQKHHQTGGYGIAIHAGQYTWENWDGLEITQAIRAKWRRRNFEEEQKEED